MKLGFLNLNYTCPYLRLAWPTKDKGAMPHWKNESKTWIFPLSIKGNIDVSRSVTQLHFKPCQMTGRNAWTLCQKKSRIFFLIATPSGDSNFFNPTSCNSRYKEKNWCIFFSSPTQSRYRLSVIDINSEEVSQFELVADCFLY